MRCWKAQDLEDGWEAQNNESFASTRWERVTGTSHQASLVDGRAKASKTNVVSLLLLGSSEADKSWKPTVVLFLKSVDSLKTIAPVLSVAPCGGWSLLEFGEARGPGDEAESAWRSDRLEPIRCERLSCIYTGQRLRRPVCPTASFGLWRSIGILEADSCCFHVSHTRKNDI